MTAETAAPRAADLLASLPTPILVLDTQDRIAAVNLAAEAFLNASQTGLSTLR